MENTKTIDYIEKDGTRLSNGILLELPSEASVMFCLHCLGTSMTQ